MGIALSLDGVAFSIYTAYGNHQRCITVEEKVVRSVKAEPAVTQIESIQALVEIAREVVKTVKLFKVRYVGMRGYAHDAKWRIHQIGEIAGAIKAYLWIVHQIAPEIVSPTVAVRHVMGSRGQFTQPEVQEMVETGLGVEVKNMLEVDATVVARYMFDKVVAEEKEIEV